VSTAGEVGTNQYLEPFSKKIFTYDHIKNEVTNVTNATNTHFNAEVEPWRASFEEHIRKYVDDFYQDPGCCAVYGSKTGGSFVITLLISSALFNPNNFWNGRWRSSWKVSFSPNGEATLEGNIKCNVHYYEEGNVQLVSNTNKQGRARAQNPGQFGKEVVDAIAKIEADFHDSLDSNYDTMSQTTFKAIRRPLPIFRHLMNWNGLAQYEVGTSFGH
jgi:capping protein (actin filament) muscle Z-line, alpha